MVGQRLPQTARSLWLTIGMAFLVLVLLEGVSRLAFFTRDERKEAQLIRLAGAAVYPGQDWIKEYYQEEIRKDLRWHSYIYWRHSPRRGKYINVDDRGRRYTWNAAPTPSPGDFKIFMFGGSAMWGSGARDEFTIASLVSKQSAASGGRRVWVANFGETGYVITQELIALILELQRGNVPDVAVFYDGFNDAWSAWQNGVAGLPENEANRAAEFNLRRRLNVRGFVEGLAVYRLSQSVVRSQRRPGRRDPALAQGVVAGYLSNVQAIQALARHYGFTPVFFWQPTVFDKKRLTEWERQISRAQEGALFSDAARLRPFYGEVRNVLKQRLQGVAPGQVNDLSGIFDDEENTVFVDPVHVSERGNEKIARHMIRLIQEAQQNK